MSPSSNYRKHTNRNALQRRLIARFHHALAHTVALSLSDQPGSLLDAGCGEGFVLDYLHRALPELQLQGLDADKDALAVAEHLGFPLYLGDASHLPFASRSFDLVICNEVLEHLQRPEQALVELARVTRGDVIVSVPRQPLFSLANLLRGRNLRQWGDDPGHLHHWTPSQFLTLVAGQLRIRKVVYRFPWVLALGSPLGR